jgi:hypothetical protein
VFRADPSNLVSDGREDGSRKRERAVSLGEGEMSACGGLRPTLQLHARTPIRALADNIDSASVYTFLGIFILSVLLVLV